MILQKKHKTDFTGKNPYNFYQLVREPKFQIKDKVFHKYFKEQSSLDYIKQQEETSDKNIKHKQIETELWLSKEFPLQFDQFMDVLNTLCLSGNASMQKMQEFLKNECL
jgi:hypothetical protein